MSRVLITVDDAEASATIEGVLTSGAVGIPVEVQLTGDRWAGLSPMLVCRASSVVYGLLLDDGQAAIPHECLMAGVPITFGVDGHAADGSSRIPTMWTKPILVLSSPADVDPLPPNPPTPDIIDQILTAATTAKEEAGQALELQTSMLATGTSPVPPRKWLNKYVDAAKGSMLTPQPTMTRLCNTAMIPMHAGDAIKVSPDNKYRVALYDADGKFLRSEPSTGFVDGGYYVVTDDYNVRVTLAMRNLSGLFPDLDGDQYCEFIPYSYLRMAYEMLGLRVADLEKGAGTGAVGSVNGMTGKVQLTAGDVGAYSKAETDGKLNKKANTTDLPTIPEKLPNPNALTFTGGAEGSYDGSKPVTVKIPETYDDKEVQDALAEIKDNLSQLDGRVRSVEYDLVGVSDAADALLASSENLLGVVG